MRLLSDLQRKFLLCRLDMTVIEMHMRIDMHTC